jgi:hypothetical protein
MTTDGVFPTEMPDEPPSPIGPLDDDTAERLLSGRLPPEDAPPSYAEVARFLRAAAGPPTPRELAGQTAALAAFRRARVPVRGSTRRGRARLVAVALAGALAVGGLWTAAAAPPAGRLRSPTGGPGAGGSGSATSASLRPAMPVTGPVTAGRPPALPSGRDPAEVRHGGGATPHRTHPGHPRKPPKGKPKPDNPKKPKATTPEAGRPGPEKPEAQPANPAKPWAVWSSARTGRR